MKVSAKSANGVSSILRTNDLRHSFLLQLRSWEVFRRRSTKYRSQAAVPILPISPSLIWLTALLLGLAPTLGPCLKRLLARSPLQTWPMHACACSSPVFQFVADLTTCIP